MVVQSWPAVSRKQHKKILPGRQGKVARLVGKLGVPFLKYSAEMATEAQGRALPCRAASCSQQDSIALAKKEKRGVRKMNIP